MNAPPPDELLKLREAAQWLSISERKLWELTDPRGPIPCIRFGRAVRYSVPQIEAWINTGNIVSGDEVE